MRKTKAALALIGILFGYSAWAVDPVVVDIEVVDFSHPTQGSSGQPIQARLTYRDGVKTRADFEFIVAGSTPPKYEPSEYYPPELTGPVAERLYEFYLNREDVAAPQSGGMVRQSYARPDSALGKKYSQYGISNIRLVITQYGVDMKLVFQYLDTDEGRDWFEAQVQPSMADGIAAYSAKSAEVIRELQAQFPKTITMGVFPTCVNHQCRLSDGVLAVTLTMDSPRDVSVMVPWTKFLAEYQQIETHQLYLLPVISDGFALSVPLRAIAPDTDPSGSLTMVPEIELFRLGRLLNQQETVEVPSIVVSTLPLQLAYAAAFDKARDLHDKLDREASAIGLHKIPAPPGKLTYEQDLQNAAFQMRSILNARPRVTLSRQDYERLGCARYILEAQ